MTRVNYTTQQYRRQVTVKQIEVPNENKVIFVPMLIDLQIPVRKVMRALQWRRQWHDLLDSLISGAASLR